MSLENLNADQLKKIRSQLSVELQTADWKLERAKEELNRAKRIGISQVRLLAFIEYCAAFQKWLQVSRKIGAISVALLDRQGQSLRNSAFKLRLVKPYQPIRISA